MIRLYFGAEPVALSDSRKAKLPQAINAVNTYGHGSPQLNDVLKDGYQVARQYLYKRQNGKCAYCEMVVDEINNPVEHFRPKAGAEDKVGAKWHGVNTHYWWMAWTWENLFFACARCNKKDAKGSKFPISLGASRIQPPVSPCPVAIPVVHYDCSGEPALLVNPRVDNPFDHLQWALVNPNDHPRNWKWAIVGRDGKGSVTVEVLKLEERTDHVNDHLQVVRNAWLEIENYLSLGSIRLAQDAWERVVESYVCDANQPYRNAVWWALNDMYPYSEQLRLGFAMPPLPV